MIFLGDYLSLTLRESSYFNVARLKMEEIARLANWELSLFSYLLQMTEK
tara:strand:- start:35652 stop:35798 length:147 start_codon:yes stop_codon:yes gene_type:complete